MSVPGKLSASRNLGSEKRSGHVELKPGFPQSSPQLCSSLQITLSAAPYSFAITTADAAGAAFVWLKMCAAFKICQVWEKGGRRMLIGCDEAATTSELLQIVPPSNTLTKSWGCTGEPHTASTASLPVLSWPFIHATCMVCMCMFVRSTRMLCSSCKHPGLPNKRSSQFVLLTTEELSGTHGLMLESGGQLCAANLNPVRSAESFSHQPCCRGQDKLQLLGGNTCNFWQRHAILRNEFGYQQLRQHNAQ